MLKKNDGLLIFLTNIIDEAQMIIFEHLIILEQIAQKEHSMFLGVKDFDVDIFLRFDDDNIAIYYSDFETIPELAQIVPLGSFDDEDGSFLLKALPVEKRIQVGLLFMERDLMAEYDYDNEQLLIRIDRIYEEFKNIPEVVDFCKKYTDRCKFPDDPNNPPSWCSDCNNPDTECPDYCEGDQTSCAIKIPVYEFYNTQYDPVTQPEKYYEDLYYITVVYFNGIYRTVPEVAEKLGSYDLFTDIDFEQNKYSMIINLKEFFTKEFIYFLKTPVGTLPFANDYGTDIKYAIQTKNTEVQQTKIQDEIDFFVDKFNQVYEDIVLIRSVNIIQNYGEIGADSWTIEVYATVAQERLVYRLIV